MSASLSQSASQSASESASQSAAIASSETPNDKPGDGKKSASETAKTASTKSFKEVDKPTHKTDNSNLYKEYIDENAIENQRPVLQVNLNDDEDTISIKDEDTARGLENVNGGRVWWWWTLIIIAAIAMAKTYKDKKDKEKEFIVVDVPDDEE